MALSFSRKQKSKLKKQVKKVNVIFSVFLSSIIDFLAIDEMNIDSVEDQEFILSEIYALQNNTEVDLELSMLGE